jgi:hypothetical protein
MDIPAPQQCFERLVRDRVQALFAEAPPSVVYHYTSWGGFEGLLKSSSFHAKHYRDLDDELEFQHADEVILDAARELSGRRRRELAASVLRRLVASYVHNRLTARPDFDVYVACFSVAADAPHLWRTQYGRYCKGYCFGIHNLDEPHPLIGDPHVIGGIMRVVHDPELIREKVTAEWKQILDALDNHPDGGTNEAHCTALNGLLHVAAYASMSFKTRRYAPEQEWRQCFWVTPESGLNMWRCEQGKRWVAWPMRKDGQRLMLDSVCVGAANGQTGLDQANELLRELGYGSGLRARLSSVVPA